MPSSYPKSSSSPPSYNSPSDKLVASLNPDENEKSNIPLSSEKKVFSIKSGFKNTKKAAKKTIKKRVSYSEYTNFAIKLKHSLNKYGSDKNGYVFKINNSNIIFIGSYDGLRNYCKS